MLPKISVIIPHHNRFNFLLQTLKSVSYQTFGDWEVIVVDDYSEPDCICKIKANIHSESRFKLITKTNETKGAPVSRNIGLRLAKGQYVLFLDSDDILAPFALEQRFNIFKTTNKKIDVVIAPTFKFKNLPGDLNEVWGVIHKNIPVMSRFTKCDTPWNTMSGLWDKKFLVSINGWNETLTSYQDWELHIRALINGLLYYEMPNHDNFYRINSDNQSIANNYFKEHIVEGRFRAFLLVIKQVEQTNNKIWIRNLRSLVLQNIILLIDQNKLDPATQILKDYKTYNLRYIDFLILKMIKKDQDCWRYRRLIKIVINLFWKSIDYDPWLHSKSQNVTINEDKKALTYNYKQLLLN